GGRRLRPPRTSPPAAAPCSRGGPCAAPSASAVPAAGRGGGGRVPSSAGERRTAGGRGAGRAPETPVGGLVARAAQHGERDGGGAQQAAAGEPGEDRRPAEAEGGRGHDPQHERDGGEDRPGAERAHRGAPGGRGAVRQVGEERGEIAAGARGERRAGPPLVLGAGQQPFLVGGAQPVQGGVPLPVGGAESVVGHGHRAASPRRCAARPSRRPAAAPGSPIRRPAPATPGDRHVPGSGGRGGAGGRRESPVPLFSRSGGRSTMAGVHSGASSTGGVSMTETEAGPESGRQGGSDAELGAALRGSGARASAALDGLYRRHWKAVLVYAKTCCRDPHTAEDLASEAFTRTLEAVRGGG